MAFYELNGLQHGEVHLISAPQCDTCRVEKITFGVNENIMAVLFLPLNDDVPPLGKTLFI